MCIPRPILVPVPCLARAAALSPRLYPFPRWTVSFVVLHLLYHNGQIGLFLYPRINVVLARFQDAATSVPLADTSTNSGRNLPARSWFFRDHRARFLVITRSSQDYQSQIRLVVDPVRIAGHVMLPWDSIVRGFHTHMREKNLETLHEPEPPVWQRPSLLDWDGSRPRNSVQVSLCTRVCERAPRVEKFLSRQIPNEHVPINETARIDHHSCRDSLEVHNRLGGVHAGP
jgi:hypothetical protein